MNYKLYRDPYTNKLQPYDSLSHKYNIWYLFIYKSDKFNHPNTRMEAMEGNPQTTTNSPVLNKTEKLLNIRIIIAN